MNTDKSQRQRLGVDASVTKKFSRRGLSEHKGPGTGCSGVPWFLHPFFPFVHVGPFATSDVWVQGCRRQEGGGVQISLLWDSCCRLRVFRLPSHSWPKPKAVAQSSFHSGHKQHQPFYLLSASIPYPPHKVTAHKTKQDQLMNVDP